MLLTFIFIGVISVFLAMSLGALFHLQWVRPLPTPILLDGTGGPARCSVVIAARDEQPRIEQTVRHLLAQQHVQVEVITVDDRSSDGTGEILKLLSKEDPRLRIIRVDRLPDGWLGKCHACHLGAQAATGNWILFTDADCWLKPEVLARALSVAEREGADHIALTPGLATSSLGTRAWHLAFLISMSNWISGVNRDRPRAYFGLGAFNLVRASAYAASGGYEALRLTVLDDVKLGLLLRRAGKKTRAFLGSGDVECHWGSTLANMIQVMEKNYFAAVDFRSATALGASLVGILLLGAAVIGPLTGTVPGLAAGLAPFSFVLPAWFIARKLGWSAWAAALTPFIFPVLLYAMLNSIVVTLWQGGVRWRETFYALETLRKGILR
ncbi:MAG TPA: glycosyltransferase family 2 protein [Verrucomicrobiae bacterium]|nr:glycosyltransferase family 2 protein [Verrucomicrobiae bacterium]